MGIYCKICNAEIIAYEGSGRCPRCGRLACPKCLSDIKDGNQRVCVECAAKNEQPVTDTKNIKQPVRAKDNAEKNEQTADSEKTAKEEKAAYESPAERLKRLRREKAANEEKNTTTTEESPDTTATTTTEVTAENNAEAKKKSIVNIIKDNLIVSIIVLFVVVFAVVSIATIYHFVSYREKLITELESPDSEIAQTAARNLAQESSTVAINALFQQARMQRRDILWRVQVIDALGNSRHPEVMPELQKMRDNPQTPAEMWPALDKAIEKQRLFQRK